MPRGNWWFIPGGLLSLSLLCADATAQQGRPFDPSDFHSLAASEHFQRWWWAFHQRAYPLADIPEGAKLRALAEIDRLKVRKSKNGKNLMAPSNSFRSLTSAP